MPSLNETKASIESIKSTQKITRAMYLMSASKSKKARTIFERSMPYFNRIAVTMSEILVETEPFESPFLKTPKNQQGKGKLYMVISAEKGLSGGYLHNIIQLMETTADKNKDTVWAAGVTGRHKIAAKKFNVDSSFSYSVMDPDLKKTREVGDKLVEAYLSGEYESVHLLYSQMINPMTIVPRTVQLLPLKPEDLAERGPYENAISSNAEFEPSPGRVFERLVPSYIRGIVYGAFVDAYTSEQNARMIAMDNSTKNASDILGKLTLMYNRARQAKITQEINEIVGGIPNE